MNKIYTKTGDKGETSLLSGKRVKKCCIEMQAVGEVDELNAILGILVEEIGDEFKTKKKKLILIQHKLFVVGAQLASVQTKLNNIPKITGGDVKALEKWIDEIDAGLPKLKNFILPGGSEEAAFSFYARAVCRRAEREIVSVSEKHEVDHLLKQYLNRLSDLLFVLARWFNKETDVEEVVWKK